MFQENCLKKGDTLMKRNILVILAVVITVAIALPVILNASTIETSRSYNTFMAEDRLFERNFYDPYNLFIFNPEKDTVLWKNGNMDPYTDHIYTLELSTLGTDLTAGAMYDIDPQTARVSLVSAEKHSCMTPWRDKVMCILDDTKIISMDYHGGNRTVIAQYDHPISNLYADENLVFFIKENKICRLHIASGVTEQICDLDEFGFELKDFTPVTTRIINLVYTNPIWEECMKANGYSYGEITDKAELQQKTGIAVNELETHETLLDLFDEHGISEFSGVLFNTDTNTELSQKPDWVRQAEEARYSVESNNEYSENSIQAVRCFFANPLTVDGVTYSPGTYFSTTGKACTCNHEQCTVSSPGDCKRAFNAIQCHGFGLFVYAHYFGLQDISDPHTWAARRGIGEYIYTNLNLSGMTITSIKQFFIENLNPGSLLRLTRANGGKHTVVITGIYDNQVRIYHGNTDNKCGIDIKNINYSWFTSNFATLYYYLKGGETSPHLPGTTYRYDQTGHWPLCTMCGYEIKDSISAHTYGADWFSCTVCGYNRGLSD